MRKRIFLSDRLGPPLLEQANQTQDNAQSERLKKIVWLLSEIDYSSFYDNDSTSKPLYDCTQADERFGSDPLTVLRTCINKKLENENLNGRLQDALKSLEGTLVDLFQNGDVQIDVNGDKKDLANFVYDTVVDRMDRLKDRLRKTQEKNARLVEELNRERTENEQKLETYTAEYEKKLTEESQRHETMQREHEKTRVELRTECDGAQEAMDNLIVSMTAQMKTTYEEQQSEIAEQQSEIEKQQNEIEEQRNENEEQQNTIEAQQQKIKRLTEKLNEILPALEEQHQTNVNNKNAMETQDQMMTMERQQNERLQEDVITLLRRLDQYEKLQERYENGTDIDNMEMEQMYGLGGVADK